MKSNIHPKYAKSIVKCACGASFETRSTKPEILIEICSACHPFYSGKTKIIDTTGRVERFKKMMAKKSASGGKAKQKTSVKKTAESEKNLNSIKEKLTKKENKAEKSETAKKTKPAEDIKETPVDSKKITA